MKYSYLFFICILFFVSACETISKKTELSKHEQWVASAFNSWTTYVLIVNFTDSTSTYSKKCFRKALAYSIDREKLFRQLTNLLADYPLDSNGTYLGGVGIYGIVPPAFADYNIKTIKGYSLNRDSAVYYYKKSTYHPNKVKGKLVICQGGNETGIDYMPSATINMSLVEYLGLPTQIQML